MFLLQHLLRCELYNNDVQITAYLVAPFVSYAFAGTGLRGRHPGSAELFVVFVGELLPKFLVAGD